MIQGLYKLKEQAVVYKKRFVITSIRSSCSNVMASYYKLPSFVSKFLILRHISTRYATDSFYSYA